MRRYWYFLMAIPLLTGAAHAEPRLLMGAVCATQVGTESVLAHWEATQGTPDESVAAVNKADPEAKCALRRILAEKGQPVNTVTYGSDRFDITPVAIFGDNVDGVIMLSKGEQGFMILVSPPTI